MKGVSSPVIEDVSLEELKRGLADGSILLVDVREPNEWDAGHIAGASLHPLSSFDPSELPREEGKRVVLQCRSGNRSAKALAIAQGSGREDVRAHYGGGMLEWTAAGEPIER
jgi:rhodanese-related sulfurtransferase